MFKLLAFVLYVILTVSCFKRIDMDFIDSLLFIGTSISATLYARLEWSNK